MKYRLNYDKCFTVSSVSDIKPQINGHEIMDIAIFFEYRVYDKETGDEIFFTVEINPEDDSDMEQYIDGYSLNEFFRCEYDRNTSTGYTMKPTDINIKSKYRVEYVVTDCYCYGYELDCEQLSYEQFCNILLTYPDAFDYSNNKPCQSGAFGWREVNE